MNAMLSVAEREANKVANIRDAKWEWYTWRDHMRAEVRAGNHIITLACPLMGGPVTMTVTAMRDDDEHIPFTRWQSTGYAVTEFTRDHTREIGYDDDGGYEFRPYKPAEVHKFGPYQASDVY